MIYKAAPPYLATTGATSAKKAAGGSGPTLRGGSQYLILRTLRQPFAVLRVLT